MPAVTPAAVQILSELRTKMGSGSTVIEGNSRAICAANAQCVVAMHPSISPACAQRNAPVQTLTTRRAFSAAICIQPTVSALRRASSTPMPPGRISVSIGSRGSGSGWGKRAGPGGGGIGQRRGNESEAGEGGGRFAAAGDDADFVALVGAALAGQVDGGAGEHLE